MNEAIQEYLNGAQASYSIKDGKILNWESKLKQPTTKQLAGLQEVIETKEKEETKKQEAKKTIESKYSVSDQLNEMRQAIIGKQLDKLQEIDIFVGNVLKEKKKEKPNFSKFK